MSLYSFYRTTFDKWHRPFIFFALAAGLWAISMFTSSFVLQLSGFFLVCLAFLILFISTIYQFIKNRWVKGMLTGAAFCIGAFALVVLSVMSFFISQSMPDPFTDDLTIPEGIELNKPIGSDFEFARTDSVVESNHPDFVLYNSFQPGLYEYDLWVENTESGTVYLKAYEITKNIPLSTGRLPKASSIEIADSKKELTKYGTTVNFTIYEGDWGKPYAARFEVWLKPASGNPERKLMEKNYIIEGWQR
ncbi:hypothetical protein PKOR_23155 [Pontibacter korlensis]|uniref:Uncharacterized protein n=1 Tax=Pontibacter korlensis TaxID=400092 RepID=A0A0E3UYS7_9BACT|nr:hypothetical protein [Pontibacter korlensis]AKD05402.1 hypothetical protein PKOR_23155 [Pontibacter korlensis]